MVCYSGPFTPEFRKEMENNFINKLKEISLKHSENLSMKTFMSDPLKIQYWSICGLPKDDTSIENGIIIQETQRWPLMIDPQLQANKFIKNLGKDNQLGIEVIKANSVVLIRQIEQSI